MKLEINLNTTLLNNDEKGKFMRVLSATTEAELETKLSKVLEASYLEYKEMLLGQGMSTRADEIRQRRLLHLIKRYFSKRMPTETEVSLLFQLTENDSKNLIKNVRTKYRYDLEDEVFITLKEVVSKTKKNPESELYEVVILSENMLEELNRLIEVLDPIMESIKKDSLSSKKYAMPADTYNLLKTHFKI